ncbi:TonB-dependent receptor plug domain-containing protein [Methylophaga sp.]|uniref:TonB-dependent receptor plug domain-containing protein n=1 Tax=Methylophaga sp. TaxID=2024840 RepID=UPI003F694E66
MFSKKTFLSQTISSCLLAALSSPAYAQPTELEQLVVTATRTPTAIKNTGSSVSVITKEEIELKQFQTLADALKGESGLRVVELGGRGSQTSVFSRGTNSNHSLVMVDGIEINDPSSPTGAFDFGNFLLEDVESIEIVKGSQSVLYGADAIGAVIHIRTKSGQGPMKARAKLEAGNKATHHETLGISGSKENINYSLTAGLFESDGDSIPTKRRMPSGTTREDDGYQNKVVSGKLGWQGDKVQASVFGRHIESQVDIDGFLSEDFDAYNTSRQSYLGAELKGQFFNDNWHPTLRITHTDIERKNRNDRQNLLGTIDRSDYEGKKDKISLQNDLYFIENNLITVGYEFEEEEMQTDGFTTFGSTFGDFTLSQMTDENRQNRAVYIQDQITFTGKFSATLGARHDNTDDFGSETTYRVTGRYELTASSQVRAAYSEGFRAPSLYELYGFTPSSFGAYRGNENLDSETSKNRELGLDQSWLDGKAESSITLFQSDIKDLITTQFSGSDSTSVNINEAEIHGLEADLNLTLTKKLDMSLNYTYTRSENEDDQQLLRRPIHQANLAIAYKPTSALRFTGSLHHVGSRKDAGDTARARMGSYAVVNITGDYTFSQHARVFARVENLFDRDYEPAWGYQGTGITGIVGVELKH